MNLRMNWEKLCSNLDFTGKVKIANSHDEQDNSLV